jgi:two-component system sensor histidine kinase TorS
VNLKKLARSLELEEEELSELVDLFLKATSSELIELQSALKEKDAKAAERMAHSMKGAAGILGLKEIYETAKKIETAAQTNRLEEIEADLRIIKEELERIPETLKGRS